MKAPYAFVYVYKSKGCKFCDIWNQSETKKRFFQENDLISEWDCINEEAKIFAKDLYKIKTVPSIIIFTKGREEDEYVVVDDFSQKSYDELLAKIEEKVSSSQS